MKKLIIFFVIMLCLAFVFSSCSSYEIIGGKLLGEMTQINEWKDTDTFMVYIAVKESGNKQKVINKYKLDKYMVDEDVSQDTMLLNISLAQTRKVLFDFDVLSCVKYYGGDEAVMEKITQRLTDVMERASEEEKLGVYIYTKGVLEWQTFVDRYIKNNSIRGYNGTHTVCAHLTKTQILDLLPNSEIINIDYYDGNPNPYI